MDRAEVLYGYMFRLLKKLFHGLLYLRADLRAATEKYLVTRRVAKVLELTHAQELMLAPRNEWPMIRSKQVEEIRAVRDGQQFDIVDRRSWSYPYLPEALHRLNPVSYTHLTLPTNREV